ncbi:MAG: hypothetical protein GVY16_10605 [Planctomycetes bacterium]|nr:hypothetical protein [Phycisphaerae bacterium]NBB96172.1 hypothetical protein [Planctomycetota bacterium]
MKVLYIGGTGEISYSCVKRDAELGRAVAVFNRGQTDEPLPDSVEQITGDIDDRQAERMGGDLARRRASACSSEPDADWPRMTKSRR